MLPLIILLYSKTSKTRTPTGISNLFE